MSWDWLNQSNLWNTIKCWNWYMTAKIAKRGRATQKISFLGEGQCMICFSSQACLRIPFIKLERKLIGGLLTGLLVTAVICWDFKTIFPVLFFAGFIAALIFCWFQTTFPVLILADFLLYILLLMLMRLSFFSDLLLLCRSVLLLFFKQLLLRYFLLTYDADFNVDNVYTFISYLQMAALQAIR